MVIENDPREPFTRKGREPEIGDAKAELLIKVAH